MKQLTTLVLSLAVLPSIAGAGAPKCDGTAFFPPDNSTIQISIHATVAGQRIVPAGLTVRSFAENEMATPLGLSHDMKVKDLAGLETDYAYDGHLPSATGLKISVYYPYQRRDVPTLELVIGHADLAAVSRRDATRPKGSDVYARFDLPAEPGLFHPGETARLRVIDPVSGSDLARATFPLPALPAFASGLQATLLDLRAHCEDAVNNPD